ncbi:aminotransferase class I/II-fold pyridoxal phosphate-dependent enzyme [Stygiolobus caldivivus]|uniref:Aminotransferase class I/classII large domain-containing protein n=1 Tax=Stygiolobus caldivivus TaxID=2824673 RepID=A0A8D5U8N0_9CREN|nr:aminotransferase class I/II-fold pyridoxal phosphate-dependent enzyme [Stygiolobus caldivivus]BCU71651.1 hypothetical protein KN1_29480 [Stygiolobus caldivivus]
MIDLSFGIPDPELLPIPLIKEASLKVIEDIRSLQYGPVEGYVEAREALAKLVELRGIQTDKNNIVLTSGAKEALYILSFLMNKDIVIEEPTYQGFISLLKFSYGFSYGGSVYTIPLDSEGIKVEELEKILKKGVRPSFLYTVTINNPTGYVTHDDNKKYLLELAEDYDFKIIE